MVAFFNRYGLVCILLLAILVRLPHLNRPLSKHHEFNTAVVLINAESWQQSGGGSQYTFTPLMNYQGAANKLMEKGLHTDSSGNHVYLSFGPGWYILPYVVFQMFSVSPTPLALQLLNLLIYSLGLVALYFLLKASTKKRAIALAGTLLFAFLPAPLWYGGNGYVNTVIMLPLVIVLLYIWNQFHQSHLQVKWSNLVILFLAGCGITWFDWFGVFILAAIFLWALVKAQRNSTYYWVVVVSFLAILSGILIVLWPFANYLGWEQVGAYWKARFFDRSIAAKEMTLLNMLVACAKNLAMGFLPLFLFLPVWLMNRKRKGIVNNIYWPIWALSATIPYNFIFLDWSANHEFAWLAFGMIATICMAIYLFPLMASQRLMKLTLVSFLFSLSIYYLINLPGSKNLSGSNYNASQIMGNTIRQKVPDNLPIFCNMPNQKIVEYYSKRTFLHAGTHKEAMEAAKANGFRKLAWIEIKNERVTEISILENP